MDIMIARDTARRAAGLLGFSPANRAQLSTAAATLAELMLKTSEAQVLHVNGVINGERHGLQISCQAPWLASASPNNVLVALRAKLGDLVDEIMLEGRQPPTVLMIMWLRDNGGDDLLEDDDDEDDA